MRVSALLVLCLLGPITIDAQQIRNDTLTVTTLGREGVFTGFAVSSGGAEVARVSLGSNGAITARAVQATGRNLRFSGLAGAPTPLLGEASWVEVGVVSGDDPYPRVSFHLDMREFDVAAWEARQGKVPFHFLVCSLPGAEVFHQRGWAIGTPVVDDYIQLKAVGPGRQIVSEWSRDWTYAPPIGAYPTAVAGLWDPARHRYVGYDFHGARLTDHTEKDFGTAYCRRCGDSEQFFCLTWPFAQGYNQLRYPTTPVQCGTHYRLLWSQELGPEDDPNRLVHEFLWREYADLLPAVERMSDLSWLPRGLRLSDFAPPGPLGDLIHSTGEDGQHWWAPDVHIAAGVSYFSPIDYYYSAHDNKSIERLKLEARKLVEAGRWFETGGDRCFFWRTPLDGGGAAFFGPGVETFHHVSGWGAGLALLDYYRNDPQGAQDMLPCLDGVLRYTRQILYTRNCYPDVPAAQFAWSATPCVTFCLKYYYRFRDDPTRRELAALAYTLARSMTYRYLALWPCDNDEMDDLDASFLMEPNAGLSWLGSACANEVWVYNIAMLYEYVATGDPIMGHYLRGMLERYHELFQDQWYPQVQDYDGAFTERLGLYTECAQGKGTRANYGGLWGGFERLVWPLGSATVRVVCGERAAMAFNRDGRRADIADYRYQGDGQCSFRLVPGGLQAEPDQAFDLTLSFPFFSLQGKPVLVSREGTISELGPERIVRYRTEPTTITVRGVRLGDTIGVGKLDPASPVLATAPLKPRRTPDTERVGAIERAGFQLLNLARGATGPLSRDWNDPRSFAGYEPGLKTLYGVPFLLLDPEATHNQVTVPEGGIAYGQKPEYLFVLVAGISDKSRLTLYRSATTQEQVDLTRAVPVLRGWPPVLEWHIDLVAVENRGQPIMSIAPTGCSVFAVTQTSKSPAQLAAVLAALAQQREKTTAEQQAIAELARLAPLFEPLSGHIGVLPVPGQANVRATRVVHTLQQAGLLKHLRLLSPRDLVDRRVFNNQSIWIALYVGGEAYTQSVARDGDGDEALISWLKGGGTLVSLAGGPFPFYYNEHDKVVVNASRFGLPISGSGAGRRLDTLDVAPVTGWEQPPAGLTFTFRVNPRQEVLTGLPATFPWRTEGDQRWRPIFNLVGTDDVYTPLVSVQDGSGRKYGEAAAMIDYQAGDLAGARVIYLWHSLREHPTYERTLLSSLLRFLLTHTDRPIAEYTCIRANRPPVIDGKLDDELWRQAPATPAFVRFDRDAGEGKPLGTTARMAWDDQALYVAWECEDPDVWSVITERDGNLWENEVVELYVDPDGDGRDYAELEINPLNAVVDLKIPRAEKGVPQEVEAARRWNAEGCVSAVQVMGTLNDAADTDRGWTVETKVPLRNFSGARRLPPHIGDCWRVQLFRIERSRDRKRSQYGAWSPTDTFHNPARFGRVTFGANPCADDFSGYDEGAVPSPTWGVTGGQWQVRAGALVGTNSGSDGWTPTGAVMGEAGWKDFRLRVRFQVRSRGSDHRDGAWIGFRYGGPEECYSLNLGTTVQLVKASHGQASGDTNSLGRAQWSADGNWHEAAITVRGAHILIELDGKSLLDVTDANHLGVGPVTSGGICLAARRYSRSEGDTVVAFDDVRVETLP